MSPGALSWEGCLDRSPRAFLEPVTTAQKLTLAFQTVKPNWFTIVVSRSASQVWTRFQPNSQRLMYTSQKVDYWFTVTQTLRSAWPAHSHLIQKARGEFASQTNHNTSVCLAKICTFRTLLWQTLPGHPSEFIYSGFMFDDFHYIRITTLHLHCISIPSRSPPHHNDWIFGLFSNASVTH